MYRLSLFHVVAVAILFSLTGASCPRNNVTYNGPTAPAVFFGTPTLDQVVQVINANSARVQQLQTNGAVLRLDGATALQADIALERPRRFRLTAGTRFTGQEIDMGSNDDVFWFWWQRDPQQAIYFARHAEFQTGAARNILPVPPQWIIEALGLVHLDELSQVSGPYPRATGGLEIRAVSSSPAGSVTRVLVVHEQTGTILEQQIYDAANVLLASAVTSDHRYDPHNGISLPHQMEIRLPPAQLALTIQVSGYLINQLTADGSQLWQMPQPAGVQPIDLMSAAIPRTSNSSWSSQPPPIAPAVRQQSPRYRRFGWMR